MEELYDLGKRRRPAQGISEAEANQHTFRARNLAKSWATRFDPAEIGISPIVGLGTTHSRLGANRLLHLEIASAYIQQPSVEHTGNNQLRI